MSKMLGWIPVAVIGSLLAGCVAPEARDESALEAEIWALEDAYWVNNRDANYDGIVSTWHDRFLGWPDREDHPIDKEEGARYVRQAFTEPAAYSFKIVPFGVRLWEDMAVNHYRVDITPKGPGGADEAYSLRIVHTWVREDGQWKVFGGMSNRK